MIVEMNFICVLIIINNKLLLNTRFYVIVWWDFKNHQVKSKFKRRSSWQKFIWIIFMYNNALIIKLQNLIAFF